MPTGHISMEFAEVEIYAKCFKAVSGIPALQTNLLNKYLTKIIKGKYKYFKCNFLKNYYTRNFDEKHVLS